MAQGRRTDEDWRALKFHAGELFTPSSPMTVAELFAGRSQQIDLLAEVVAERGRHAILYGEPGVGKTSTAMILKHRIPSAPQRVHFYRHPVVSSDTYSSIWKEIFKGMAPALIMNDFSRPQSALGSSAPDLTQNDVIRRMSEFKQNTIPIIVIDEYQQFKDTVGAGYISETIKALSDASCHATIIVVGVGDTVDDLVRGHKSITRCSEEVLMPRMHNDELHDLLWARVNQLGMKMEGDAKWKIITLAKGLPAVAHSLGKSSVHSAISRRSSTVTESDVDVGIAATVASSKQTLKSVYEHATNSNQARSRLKHLITACALTKPDASGWFAPKDVVGPFSNIVGSHRRIDHFNANLKDFSTDKRGDILQIKGEERAHRFRFTDVAMQPYVLMKGIEAGLIDKKSMSILSSPEQDDLFSGEP